MVALTDKQMTTLAGLGIVCGNVEMLSRYTWVACQLSQGHDGNHGATVYWRPLSEQKED